MAELPEGALRLLEGRNLAHFVTLMKDGSPQVTPVWVDHDGTHILVNTADFRLKLRNVMRDPRVAVSVVDRDDDVCYLEVRGRVVEVVSGDEAWQQHARMASRYSGRPIATVRPVNDRRRLIKIYPEHVKFATSAREH
jgi:PPOX class probable F420-dependent enzyme